MFVDSHCHLNYPGLVENEAAAVGRARTAGVTAMLNISTRRSEWDAVLAAAERHDDVWAAIGVHPHDADAHGPGSANAVDAATLLAHASHPRVIALGESGLDYHYDKSDRARQRDNFRIHIDAARQSGLPIVVHTRDAEDDTAAILREGLEEGAFTGVIHCFTSSAAFADIALDLGFYISISGIVTFKNARDLQDIARKVPQDRLLIETDAPFLAPVPHRGRPCEPAHVADTARFLADLRGERLEALAEATSRNFHALFTKAA